MLLEHGYRVVANSRTISDSKDLRLSASLVLVDGDIGKKETRTKVADAALEHFDHTLAMEYVADGIRANTISPRCRRLADARQRRSRASEEASSHSTPGADIRIVDALLYLESAPMVNGENIRIDGGAHAGAKW